MKMSLFCDDTNDNFGEDEIYVTSSYNWASNGKGGSSLCWSGDMDETGPKSKTTKFLLDNFVLRPGDEFVYTINVYEQDGDDYKPGLKFAAAVAKKIGTAIAAATGAAAVAAVIESINIGAIIKAIPKNNDDHLGTFIILVSCLEDGSIEYKFYPKHNSRWRKGVLHIDGDDSVYWTKVYFNDKRVV